MFNSRIRFKAAPQLPMPSLSDQWAALLRRRQRNQTALMIVGVIVLLSFWGLYLMGLITTFLK